MMGTSYTAVRPQWKGRRVKRSWKYDITLKRTGGCRFEGKFNGRHNQETTPVTASCSLYWNEEGLFLIGKWLEDNYESIWWAELKRLNNLRMKKGPNAGRHARVQIYRGQRPMKLTPDELEFLSAWAREEWEPACYHLPAHRLQLAHGVSGAQLIVFIKAWTEGEGKKDQDLLSAAVNAQPRWPWSTTEEFAARLEEAGRCRTQREGMGKGSGVEAR
jgi:hypothetical protein